MTDRTTSLGILILKKGIGVVTLLLGASASPLYIRANPVIAQETTKTKLEEKVNIEANLYFYSKYIFRGLNFGNKPIFQPSLTLNYKDVIATILGTCDTGDENANEFDLLLDYTKEINKEINLSFGYNFFRFIDLGQNTQEVYAGVSLNRALSPSFMFYHDFDLAKGNYAELSISKSNKFKNLSLNTKASLGYNDRYFWDKSGFSHLDFQVLIAIKISDKVTICPRLNYIKALNKDFKNEFVSGIGVNIRLK